MTNLSEGERNKYIARSEDVQRFCQLDITLPFIIISITLGIACIIFNLVVFNFYRAKQSNFIHRLYTVLSVCDMGSGLACLVNALMLCLMVDLKTSVASTERAVLYYVVPISYCCTALCAAVTVFVNLTLSVVRTINIVWPVYQVKRRVVYSVMIGYAVLWSAIIGYDIYSTYSFFLYKLGQEKSDRQFWFNQVIYYFCISRITGSEVIMLLFDNEPSLTSGKVWSQISYAVFGLGVWYVIPSVICVLCCAVQMFHLLRLNVTKSASKINRRITVTVMLLTLLFFVCNVTYFTAAFLIALYDSTSSLDIAIISYVTSNTVAYLNSVLNPIILITRGKTLRLYFNTESSKVTRHFTIVNRASESNAGEDQSSCTSL